MIQNESWGIPSFQRARAEDELSTISQSRGWEPRSNGSSISSQLELLEKEKLALEAMSLANWFERPMNSVNTSMSSIDINCAQQRRTLPYPPTCESRDFEGPLSIRDLLCRPSSEIDAQPRNFRSMDSSNTSSSASTPVHHSVSDSRFRNGYQLFSRPNSYSPHTFARGEDTTPSTMYRNTSDPVLPLTDWSSQREFSDLSRSRDIPTDIDALEILVRRKRTADILNSQVPLL